MLGKTCVLLSCALLAALLFGTDGQARAQGDESSAQSATRLINLDTVASLAKGGYDVQAGVRVFGAAEDRTFGQASLSYGLSDTMSVAVRGGFTGKTDFVGPGFTIRHGGNDIEVLARYKSLDNPCFGYQLGLAFPDTPAQDHACVTAQVVCQHTLAKRVTLVFTPKAVLKESPLIGLGGGVSVQVTPSISLVGDITGLLSGNNSYSPLTGDLVRQEVWGAGLCYTMKQGGAEMSLEVGATNGLGGTTGLSMTPGLGGSTSVYAALSYRK